MERDIGPMTSEESVQLMELLMKTTRRNTQNVIRHKTEMLAALESIERLRKSCHNAEMDNRELLENQKRLEAELDEKDSKLKTLQAEVKDARAQVRCQLEQNSALKADLDEMETRFKLVTDLLERELDHLSAEDRKQLAFLREPALVRKHSKRIAQKNYEEEEEDTTSDTIDYDQTGDSMDLEEEEEDVHLRAGRSYRRSSGIKGRRSASAHAQPHAPSKRNRSRLMATAIDEEPLDDPLPRKRSKGKENMESGTSITATATVTVEGDNYEGGQRSRTRVTIRRSLNRSMSESNLIEEKTNQQKSSALRGLQNTPRTTSTMDLRTPLRTPAAKSWAKNGPIESRPHTFEKLSSYFKMTNCDVCHGGINFAAKPAVKCTDCQQHVHVTCSKRLNLPCVPRVCTPLRTPNKARGQPATYRLQDFCPPTAPMIAYPIIHCVVALEKRGLHHEGIYRVPGKKSQVTAVLNELRTARALPKLELQDIEVIPDCIKQFLRELRDPLIPKSSREEFVRAALAGNTMALNVAICDLPDPNLATLAYLVLHWQRVISQCQLNKMPKENVARCVALSVMGQSSYNRGDMSIAARETGERERVLMELLNLPADYWQRFISDEPTAPTPSGSRLLNSSRAMSSRAGCDSPSAVNRSILGPVSESPVLTPNLIRPIPRRPHKFFDSPK